MHPTPGSRRLTSLAAAVAIAAIVAIGAALPARAELTPGTPAPDLPAGAPWINGPPLSLARELKGKVVLVDFWEYTCINCIRTLPSFRKLYAAYHPLGLEIVGVHAPEFDFAYRTENVATGTKRLRIPWPVVVDSDFRIWRAYDSNSWPNDFLVNAKGIIVHQRAGEGGYADLETLVRAQLSAAHRGLKLPPPVLPPDGRDFDPANCGRMSVETYVGTARGTRWGGAIGNSEGFRPGQIVDYRSVARPVSRGFHARGLWKNDPDAFEHARAAAPLADWIGLAYEGAEVYAVMNVSDGRSHRVYVTRDGQAVPPDRRGVDVKLDARGRTYIDVLEGRMYYVIQGEDAAKHELRLSPVDRGVRINSFTFGNRCLTKFDRL
jgi:thiol-disulfide isomerase/thioredoxin